MLLAPITCSIAWAFLNTTATRQRFTALQKRNGLRSTLSGRPTWIFVVPTSKKLHVKMHVVAIPFPRYPLLMGQKAKENSLPSAMKALWDQWNNYLAWRNLCAKRERWASLAGAIGCKAYGPPEPVFLVDDHPRVHETASSPGPNLSTCTLPSNPHDNNDANDKNLNPSCTRDHSPH